MPISRYVVHVSQDSCILRCIVISCISIFIYMHLGIHELQLSNIWYIYLKIDVLYLNMYSVSILRYIVNTSKYICIISQYIQCMHQDTRYYLYQATIHSDIVYLNIYNTRISTYILLIKVHGIFISRCMLLLYTALCIVHVSWNEFIIS